MQTEMKNNEKSPEVTEENEVRGTHNQISAKNTDTNL